MVGSVDEIAAMDHNLVYSPSFRSDLHGEMVVLNYFEEENPQITLLKDILFILLWNPAICA